MNGASPEAFHEHYRSARIQWKDAITIAGYFSGFDDLPDYKTYKEWQEAMQDEADASPEDDLGIYGAANEIEAVRAWIHKT